MAGDADSTQSAWAPLRRPVFRMLWSAQLGSNIGLWMQTVGAQWFLVEESNSSALVAWVQTANQVPVLLLALLSGALAERFDRRRLLLIAAGASTVVSAGLTVYAFLGLLEPWSLLAFTFALGCCAAVTTPAWQAIQPELVPRGEMPAAIALGGITINGARSIGPAIAGFLVAGFGSPVVFAINAASFVGVAIALGLWRREPTPSFRGESLGRSITGALRYVRAAPIVRRLLVRLALFTVPGSALWALMPVVADRRLDTDAAGYGVMLAALGIGAVSGAILLPQLRRGFSPGALLAASAGVFGLGALSLAIWPYPAVLVTNIFAGAAWLICLTTILSSVQLTLAPWVRARGLAVYVVVLQGTQGLGAFAWGAVSDLIGTTTTLLLATFLLVIACLSILVVPLLPGTGTLDRSPGSWDGIDLAGLTPDDGRPLEVEVAYAVPGPAVPQFVDAMRSVELSRRRTGARAWRLGPDPDVPDGFRESFRIGSAAELRRQATERWMQTDQDSWRRAAELSIEPPGVSWRPVERGRGRRRDRGAPPPIP